MTVPLLEVSHLSAGYGSSLVLSDVSLHVEVGELVAIVGSNGAGKTTLLRTLVGQVSPWAGHVLLDGVEVTGERTESVVGRGVALCPEGRHVFPDLTVEDNLLVGGFLRRRDEVREGLTRMQEWFPRLAERSQQSAGTLSGGEQQMLAIARSLMSRPRLLLLDEPSLGLAPVIVDQVLDVIETIATEGITTVLVEQNAQLALSHAQRAYVLEAGAMVKSGNGTDLLADKEVKAAYLGI